MNWLLPFMPRKELAKLPMWWCWPLMLFISIALAALVLFFTWPVQRGFANSRFWIYLLVIPFLLAFAFGAFILSASLQARRAVLFRHLYTDNKQAQWHHWAHRSLKLTGWNLLTPEPDLAVRILGFEGVIPQAPAKPTSLIENQKDKLSASPLADIITQTLTTLSEQLRKLQGVQVWLFTGEAENTSRIALIQAWKIALNKQLPPDQIHYLEQSPDDRRLTDWTNETLSKPHLLLCCQLLKAESQASEYSVALLFQPHSATHLNSLKLKPVYVFRPQRSPLTEFEHNAAHFLGAGQTESARLRHLWDNGLERREHSKLISLLDERAIAVPPNNVHILPQLLGPLAPSGFWLTVCLAAAGCDLGQRGQLVAAQSDESISLVQLSTQPAAPVDAPRDNISRYPLAYLGGIFAVMLALILLPSERDTQIAMLPWLGGGLLIVAALLSFSVPLALRLWRKQLDVEWHLLEQNRHD
ncbi:hypothetical protein [Rahnella selenatireducens]|uniref:hypothetical protein n=1 Tax=Rahnella selenatireducens TaxID=3389797 RepID=UPI003969AECB